MPVSAAIVAAFSAFALQGAFGQDQDNSNVVVMEKFEVTGSYIPFAGTATAIPVTTITAADIENTGIATNPLEILRKVNPAFTGNGNLGNSNSNIGSGSTGGGSQLAFRNTQTLVLINGRRSAYAPILASGGYQYVDVNLIPPAAIESIEVLQDGASAIYGTDAVAGVVNFKLKSNYQGMEIGGRFAHSDNKGRYEERSGYMVSGGGNEKAQVTISASWTDTDPLMQYERNFSNPSYGTATFGGVINRSGANGGGFYVLNPSLNGPPTGAHLTFADLVANGTYIPVDADNLISGLGNEQQYAFNLSQYVTLLVRNQRRAVTANFEYKAADNVTFFGDLLYSNTNTFSQINAQPTSASYSATNPLNPSNETITVRNRFLDHPRQYFYDTYNARGTIGARGSFGNDFGWEVGFMENRIHQDYQNPGVIDTVTRGQVVGSGLLNYFLREQAPGAVEESGMFGTALGQAISSLSTIDARMNGKLFTLPAGDVGFAIGVEKRKETLSQTADRNSQGATFGWDSATTLDPFSGSRHVEAAFLDVRVPIIDKDNGKGMKLVAEAAVRHERYSDTDNPTVPKFTLAFNPVNDEFLMRGTYSESFAAPTLFQLFGPGGIGYTTSLNLDKLGGGSITGQALIRSGANPGLEPSTSTNQTFGIVYSPRAVRGLTITVDWFNIKQEKLISTIGSTTILQDVELNGTASPYAQFVKIGSAPSDTSMFELGSPITAAGQIGNAPSIDSVYVTDTLVNISNQKLRGVDFSVSYAYTSDTLGTFDTKLTGIWWDHYKAQTLPGTDEFDTVGQATNWNGTLPTWQTYLSVDWRRGNWGANFGYTFIPSVNDVNWYDDTDPTADENIEAYNAFDLSVRYTFNNANSYLKGLTVRFGANNITNEMPPSGKGTFTEANADIATYNPIGRLWYIEGTYRF